LLNTIQYEHRIKKNGKKNIFLRKEWIPIFKGKFGSSSKKIPTFPHIFSSLRQLDALSKVTFSVTTFFVPKYPHSPKEEEKDVSKEQGMKCTQFRQLGTFEF